MRRWYRRQSAEPAECEVGTVFDAASADETAAKSALDAAVARVGSSVSIPTPQSFSVGDNGTLFSGSSPDQSKSVTVVMFTQGKAFTTLKFDGAPNDPVAVDFANDVGQKQDAAIKAGLSS